MDAAACKGDLGIVKFLHENRTEGCTRGATDDAASNNHMGVAKYLLGQRQEG
jgi:hypothetical protein